MEELSPIEKTQIVSDLVGDWFEENNMHLLAKEGEVVYWTSITGEAADLKWHKLSVVEASRIAKVMVVPPQYMAYCTSDSIYTAAQERGRAYMEGHRSSKKLSPLYFNFMEHEGESYNPYFHTTLNTLKWFELYKVNVQWVLIKSVIRKAWKILGIDDITDTELNKYIREAVRDTHYKCQEKTNRYMYNGKQYTCIRYRKSTGIVEELEPEDEQELVLYIVEKHNGRNKLNRSKPS